ncbi:MAG: ribonuclease P protein component [Bacteroidaceae bacterium]|nr:ribonuclease P protein component [Bacteroidaceae bacterium]
MAFGLSKKERLCSKKAIDALFAGADSKSLLVYPVRAVFRNTEEAGIRILVSVSKKRFRHAVDRNRVKRQLREAYRLNKNILATGTDVTSSPRGLDIAFIWLTDRHQPSATVASRMVSLLEKVAQSRLQQ